MKLRKILALTLATLLGLALIPLAHVAADTVVQSGPPSIAVGVPGTPGADVAFAGLDWVVIGYDGVGVHSAADTLTLLLKNDEFGTTPFRGGAVVDPGGWTLVGGTYYEGSFTDPSDYEDSTLQQELAAIAGSFPAAEQGLIQPRNLTDVNGAAAANQLLWPLSMTEAGDCEQAFSAAFWLRTYASALTVHTAGILGAFTGGSQPEQAAAIRPALQLDLSDLFLISSAASDGKGAATLGGGFLEATAPSGAIKLTVGSAAQTLAVLATPAQAVQTAETLQFSYENATTGADQFVSAVLTDSGGTVVYYGKMADSSADDEGGLSVPLAGVANGTYTLSIFSEQANSDTNTDFASAPISMTVTVAGGEGTVSGFDGTVLYSDDASLLSVLGESVIAGNEAGTLAAPKTTAITVDNDVDTLTLADIAAAATATVHFYSDAAFSADEDMAVSLAEGDNEIYVKVTAEDGTTVIFYQVTVTRSTATTTAPHPHHPHCGVIHWIRNACKTVWQFFCHVWQYLCAHAKFHAGQIWEHVQMFW
ncbi:MAG: cadherin-like beta sandwich domain-containing protein [Oscillospiraceae bacterium]|jgi:hypothetical protein|nr:cadherin-like beta sandwich domain-containing protein [Oscillospiraceae bacterium]